MMERYVLVENDEVIGSCWTNQEGMLPIGNGVTAVRHDEAQPGWKLVDGQLVEPEVKEQGDA